mgnify:FL=1
MKLDEALQVLNKACLIAEGSLSLGDKIMNARNYNKSFVDAFDAKIESICADHGFACKLIADTEQTHRWIVKNGKKAAVKVDIAWYEDKNIEYDDAGNKVRKPGHHVTMQYDGFILIFVYPANGVQTYNKTSEIECNFDNFEEQLETELEPLILKYC